MNVYLTRINGRPLTDKAHYIQHMVSEIAHQLGCKEMGIYRYSAENESAESLYNRLDGIIAGINRGDLVICQFPTGNGMRFEKELVRHLKAYGGRIAIFIHELEILSTEEKRLQLRELMGLYNQAEVLIVPTYAMRKWLLENGIRVNMKFIVQEMWDYTVSESVVNPPTFKKEIYFTDSDGFVGMDSWSGDVSLKLYNISASQGQSIPASRRLEPFQIFSELMSGGFGLVWYRDEYSRKYMEYSISFSFARYLAAGIPVIVPVGISHQTLVEINHLGLVVNSLEEAKAAVEKMTEGEYQGYVKAVEQFAPALRNGYYTRKCLIESMQAFYRKDAGRIPIPEQVYGTGNNEFKSIVLKESYGGNLALSWNFQGEAEGFLIYDEVGNLVGETRNIHQHYFLIKGKWTEKSFVVKAYADTLKGKRIIAESALTCLDIRGQYNMPKVSLLMPVYNGEGFVARSIDTALAQTFSDLEIIIVDDGSEDHTAEIIDWYAEKYVNVVAVHQENGGTPAARNIGIEHANGEYIGFMDSDDMIHPDMIARLYDSIITNDCDVALSPLYLIMDGIYEPIARYPMKENIAYSTDDFFRMHFEKGCMFATVVVNKLYKASLVKEHLLPLIPVEDNAWTPYILSYTERICYLDSCFYEYDRCIRNNTVTDELSKKSNEEIFRAHKGATIFYLQNGNVKRRDFLKKLAKKQLTEFGRAYHYDEYEKVWKQIEENF